MGQHCHCVDIPQSICLSEKVIIVTKNPSLLKHIMWDMCGIYSNYFLLFLRSVWLGVFIKAGPINHFTKLPRD